MQAGWFLGGRARGAGTEESWDVPPVHFKRDASCQLPGCLRLRCYAWAAASSFGELIKDE